jgi:hypothetical protein
MEKLNGFLKNQHEASSLEVLLQNAGTVPCITGANRRKTDYDRRAAALEFPIKPRIAAVFSVVIVGFFFGNLCA